MKKLMAGLLLSFCVSTCFVVAAGAEADTPPTASSEEMQKILDQRQKFSHDLWVFENITLARAQYIFIDVGIDTGTATPPGFCLRVGKMSAGAVLIEFGLTFVNHYAASTRFLPEERKLIPEISESASKLSALVNSAASDCRSTGVVPFEKAKKLVVDGEELYSSLVNQVAVLRTKL